MYKFLLIAVLLFSGAFTQAHCRSQYGSTADPVIYSSPALQVVKLTDHVYMHTSYLQTEDFGKVPCNGMIVSHGGEAVVFDTPANEESTRELILFLKSTGVRVRAVIATHFHADCVAGLKEFHRNRIPSFAENRTIKILQNMDTGFDLPETGFDGSTSFLVGDKKVYAGYFGSGHTRDNIIGYFPDQKVLFGGCLIKEMGAGRGNLEDANVAEWAHTVKRIRLKFPDIQTVIPGHGTAGDAGLLGYTIRLFEQ